MSSVAQSENLPPTSRSSLDIKAALLASVVGTILGAGFVVLSANVTGMYGVSLFIGLPMVTGAVATWVYAQRAPLVTSTQAMKLALLAGLVLCSSLLLMGVEGAICVLMALPLSLPLSLLGGLLGYVLVTRAASRRSQAWTSCLLVLSLPMGLGVEWAHDPDPPLRAATTEIVIHGTSQQVWDALIDFAPITAPPQGVFRWGIAYPIGATILGHGPGAVRHCEFSTGTFVEPITHWDEPRLLAFDVAETPTPMRELSFYEKLDPPHLHGMFMSRKGEFRLQSLPGGDVRLVGTTWYQHDLWPNVYWGWLSDWLIHQIHERVLAHIRDRVELAP